MLITARRQRVHVNILEKALSAHIRQVANVLLQTWAARQSRPANAIEMQDSREFRGRRTDARGWVDDRFHSVAAPQQYGWKSIPGSCRPDNQVEVRVDNARNHHHPGGIDCSLCPKNFPSCENPTVIP